MLDGQKMFQLACCKQLIIDKEYKADKPTAPEKQS